MRLRVIAVGRDRSGLYAPAIEEYAKRLGRYVKFELVEVPEARKHAGTAQAKEEEAEALLAKLGPRERVVALDERGAEWTSVAFAERVRRWTEGGRDVALVIGGSDGLARGAGSRRGDARAVADDARAPPRAARARRAALPRDDDPARRAVP